MIISNAWLRVNVLLKHDRAGTATYAPYLLHTRLQALRDLIDEHDHDRSVQLKAALQEQIETWRNEYDVDSPPELRARASEAADDVAT